MIHILIVLIILVSSPVRTLAQDVGLPHSQLEPPSQTQIGENKEGVRIETNNEALGNILQRIGAETGIQFILPESIKEKPTTVSILERDWPSALSRLLQDFNRMEVWDEDLNQTRIRILGDGDMEAIASIRSSTQIPPKRDDPIKIDTGYYKTQPMKQGDWVAIKTRSRNRPSAKQVLAVPGDTVEIKEGQLWVNGRLQQKYLNGAEQKVPAKQMKSLQDQVTRLGSRVPEGLFIATGDNAGGRFENTDYRLISVRRLLGRVK